MGNGLYRFFSRADDGGKIMAASVNPPERMDHPIFKRMTKKTNPNKPKIMEGTPARQSVPKRIIRLILLSRVYSVKKNGRPNSERGAHDDGD